MSSIRKTKWENFILEISNLIFFWFFSVCFFLAFRIAFICIFFAETNWDSFILNISQTLITGFRFDTMVVSYFVILPFLSTLITPIFNKIELAIRESAGLVKNTDNSTVTESIESEENKTESAASK